MKTFAGSATRLLWVAGLMCCGVTACSSKPVAADDCVRGTEACECAEGVCNEGLECHSNVCVGLNSMSSGAAGASAMPASGSGGNEETAGVGGTDGGMAVDTWTQQPVPTTADIAAVWGTSGSDVFAVGSAGTILHYDGIEWGAMESGTVLDLNGVWGLSSTDVYAVGDDLTILHYDGTGWTAMVVPQDDPPRDFNSIWGRSGKDLWVVGTGMLRMHYDGSKWSGSTDILTDWLASVWGYGSDSLIAVGRCAAYRYEDRSWAEEDCFSVSSFSESGAKDEAYISALHSDLRGVWSADGQDVFVVGDYDVNGSADGDESGAVFKLNPASGNLSFIWRDQVPDLRAVSGTSASDVWITGLRGTVVHYDGTTFSRVEVPATKDLVGVWCDKTSVFAVGRAATVVHLLR